MSMHDCFALACESNLYEICNIFHAITLSQDCRHLNQKLCKLSYYSFFQITQTFEFYLEEYNTAIKEATL